MPENERERLQDSDSDNAREEIAKEVDAFKSKMKTSILDKMGENIPNKINLGKMLQKVAISK